MKKILYCHRFFVKQSRSYVDLKEWRNKMRYPFAYLKFMWYSIGDIIRAPKYNKLSDIDTGA